MKTYSLYKNGEFLDSCSASDYEEADAIFGDSWDLSDEALEIEED